jgi:formamidopyrimidine-DNA glycosylase
MPENTPSGWDRVFPKFIIHHSAFIILEVCMPELPEVEGMRRRLAQLIVGRAVVDVEDVSGTATRSCAPVPFREGVVGHRFTGTDRRAKNLLLSLDSGDTLVMHFMREGMLEHVPAETERAKHTQAVMRLDDGNELRLRDTMRTARWTLCSGCDYSNVSSLQKLGPEYTDPAFTPEYLKKALGKKAPIKALLIDQKLLSGVGNAYAHEIAWEAKIRPDRPGSSLTDEEVRQLHAAVHSVFDRAIAAREASALTTMGDEGWEVARIHRRKGQPCPECGAGIEGEKLGGNLIYYCPECQK